MRLIRWPLTLLTLMLWPLAATAAAPMKFDFKDADLTKVIEDYSKSSGQKFIVDPQVHGKITILNSEPVSQEEAFNQLSTALAVNGCAISHQDDMMVVSPARHI